MMGVAPVTSAWANDSAPAVRLAAAPSAVSTLRSGNHARFSYTKNAGGL